MFTDMVGFTALGQRDESLSLALLEEQRSIIRPILGRHRGREVKTMGDAFLVEFPNALDAVRCAYDIQRAVREFNISLPSEKRIHLRVGLHLGDVVESQGDISGDAVNVASRIEPLAEVGGVCLTRQVYDNVHSKFELPITSLGLKPLKNVATPLEVYRIVMPWEKEGVPSGYQLDRKRVAVLPFDNMSPDPADEFFSDGMTEEVISTLSKIGGLSVIARTSVMKYKDGAKGVDEIGRELSAGSILEGSVRKAGERLRITVQLIDPVKNDHVWSEIYDRELKDVFAVQADIAQNIARSLQIRLGKGDTERIAKEPTKSPEAYALYLKGRNIWDINTVEDFHRAIRYFEKAIQLDSEFALCYAGIADSYGLLWNMGALRPGEAFSKASYAAQRALELDINLAEAHASMAIIHYNQYDWQKSRVELEEAVRLNPNSSIARCYLAIVMFVTGEPDRAMVEIQRAVDLDPYSLFINYTKGQFLYFSRECDKAIELFRELLEIDSEFPSAHEMLGYCYLQKSKPDEAVAEFREAVRVSSQGPGFNFIEAELAAVYATIGNRQEARKMLDRIKKISKTQYVPPDMIGTVHLAMGETSEAFKLFEEAYEQRCSPFAIQWAKYDPFFDGVRSDPRFSALLRKYGLEIS
jgi:TolB-like protein/Tfp pilus assembly protein PilF